MCYSTVYTCHVKNWFVEGYVIDWSEYDIIDKDILPSDLILLSCIYDQAMHLSYARIVFRTIQVLKINNFMI